jgi:hypothetical protein
VFGGVGILARNGPGDWVGQFAWAILSAQRVDRGHETGEWSFGERSGLW